MQGKNAAYLPNFLPALPDGTKPMLCKGRTGAIIQGHPFKVGGLEPFDIGSVAAGSVISWEVRVSKMVAAVPGLL